MKTRGFEICKGYEDKATLPLFYEKRVPEVLLQNDDLNEELAEILEDEGYRVVTADNAERARELHRSRKPDLILLDIMLPKINGFELLEYIKTYEIPTIFLTAKSDIRDKVAGLRAGAEDYITKPFNPLEVVARVKTQLRRYQSYNSPNLSQSEEKDEYDIRGLLINRVSHKCYLYTAC